MSTAEVYPNQKVRVHCPCKCGAYGVPKGKIGHPKECVTCRSCKNGQSAKMGKKAQVSTAIKMGSQRASKMHPGNEETLDTFLRFEKKTGAGQHTVQTFYDRTKAQSDASRNLGDNRPYVGVSERDGRSLWVIAEDDWDMAAYLTAEARGWVS